MQTDPELCREITHLFHRGFFFLFCPTEDLVSRKGNIERNLATFRNYLLHSDALNREMIGSGSVRRTGLESRRGEWGGCRSFFRQIISSELPVHILTSVLPLRHSGLLLRSAACVLPLSALLSFMTLTPSNIKFTTPIRVPALRFLRSLEPQ